MRIYLFYLYFILGFFYCQIPVTYGNGNGLSVKQIEFYEDNKISDSIPINIFQLQNKLGISLNSSLNAIEYLGLATDFLDTQKYENALDASLIAFYIAKMDEDIELKMNALLIIAQINVFWENAATGLSIYNNVEQILIQNKIEISNNLQLLIYLGKSNAYLKLKKPEVALKYIDSAFIKNVFQAEGAIKNEFIWNAGIAFYQKGEYQQAIDSIDKVVSNSSTEYHLILSKYIKGQLLYSSGSTEEAIKLYLEIDELLSKQNILFPERKYIYESINDYYQKQGNLTSQFLYLNKFLEELNYYTSTTFYIQKKTNEYYEIPEIIKKKQFEIDQLEAKKTLNDIFNISITIMFLIVFVLLLFQLKKNQLNKKRFEYLMGDKHNEFKNENEKNSQELSVEVIREVLQKLENFEKNNEFLDKEISLNDVSKRFNTNSTYLSKVVNLKKDKNFSNYINDLRIEFCISMLKSEKKKWNYTIKAIANEVGFNNAQSFSNAFYKFTGIYPSYFIEQLKKADKKE